MSPSRALTQNVQGDLCLQPPLCNLDDLQENLTLYQFQFKTLKIDQSIHIYTVQYLTVPCTIISLPLCQSKI